MASVSSFIADFHCDTLLEIVRRGGDLSERPKGQLDIRRLQKAGVDLQVFAVYAPALSSLGPLHEALLMIEAFWRSADRGALRPVLWREDVYTTAPGVGGMLSLEGAEPLRGDLDLLELFFRLGVRAMGLTWNGRNALADGVGESIAGGGLTSIGRLAIAKMNDLGMLVDVSHLSEAGFWDVVSTCRGPFIASHSNAKALCPHGRNLCDDQLRAVAAAGGVVGLNFYPPFLVSDGEAGITDVLRHADHMLSVMGRGHVGLGSDYDGVNALPRGIEGVQSMPALVQALTKEFGGEVAGEILGKSFGDLLVANLPARPHP
jgi:membrane dipeptidase